MYLNRQKLSAIDAAIKVAEQGNMSKRHGAVALYKGKVVGRGYNSLERSSALQRLYANKVGKPLSVYNHAEVTAIEQAKGKLDTLIVIRLSKSGEFLESKPCEICRELLRDLVVKDIIYSTKKGMRCL